MGAGVEPRTPLRQAVEDAYRLFKAEPPGHWSGDDMGVGKEDWDRLTNVPLRELNRSDTYHFLSESNKPTRREVRYMLPRLLEMLAEGDAPTVVAIDCSLSCLAQAGYPADWPDAERESIERFFHELLRAYCADPPAFRQEHAIGGYLCMIGSAGGDVPAALKVLDEIPKQQLARVVAEWIGPWNAREAWWVGMHNSFWEMAPVNYEEAVLDWLKALDPLRMLEEAFFVETDPHWRQTISAVYEGAAHWRPRDTPGTGNI